MIKRTKKISSWHGDLKDLNKAMEQISEINGIINNRMKEYQQREKVKQVYNKFDISSLKIEIITPSRYFIMDNDNKDNNDKYIITKHDKFGKAINIYMVLFNDGIIYGHNKSRSSFIGKPKPFLFDNLLPFNHLFEIQDIGQIYKNLDCIKILSSVESIWISFMDKSYKMEWINKMNNANIIQLNKNKNIRNYRNKEIIQCVCLVPDDFSDKCMECDDKFSMTNRRHHCYFVKCGKLVCGKCSDFEIKNHKSPNNTDDKIRVCKSCMIMMKENDTKRISCFSRIVGIVKCNFHIVVLVIVCLIVFQKEFLNLLLKIIHYILSKFLI